jgi:dihydroflavonol-4-reductase
MGQRSEVTVFVTGGSGVVGSVLVDHLVAQGHHVRALTRSDASAVMLEERGAEPVRGDILGPGDTLRAAIGDAELAYHVAGVNEMCTRDPGAMVRANVEGSVNVVEAARSVGVERIVYTSSAATLGEVRGTVGSEDSPHRGWHLSHYERSKHLAEQAVMSIEDMDIVSVNPSSVQGPGRTSGTGKIVLDVVAGKLPAVVDTDLSIVDIDDCARGHLAAASRGRRGSRYVLNSFTTTMREAIDILEIELGRSLPVRFLPRSMVGVAGAIAESVGRVSGSRPPLCREMARTLLHGHRYDGSRAARELGVTYSTAPDLLARLVQWYRSEGLIEH